MRTKLEALESERRALMEQIDRADDEIKRLLSCEKNNSYENRRLTLELESGRRAHETLKGELDRLDREAALRKSDLSALDEACERRKREIGSLVKCLGKTAERGKRSNLME